MGDRSIGRADIESSPSEPNSPNPALETYYRQQLEQLYAAPSEPLAVNDATKSGNISGALIEQAQGEDEEGYDFRLFKRPSEPGPALVGGSNVLQRIVLRSPSPASGGSGFANGRRPDTYYFAGDTGRELAGQYAQVAVSGQDIMEGLKMRWRGMELPWRVTVIKTTQAGKAVGLEHHSAGQGSTRQRSGKKRRLVVRRKFEARAAKEAAARETQTEKEAAEREKRTRKNREKKIKKRQKDKLKKVHDVEVPA